MSHSEEFDLTSALSAANARNGFFDQLFSQSDLRWMGQNTTHVPTHPAVRAAIAESLSSEEFHAYSPPMGFEELRQAIVGDLGVADMEALVTEGGVNGLFLICRARCKPGTRFVTTDPGWQWPAQFAQQLGAELVEIPIYDPATAYKLTPQALRDAVDDRTSIIYIVDPNNPLGISYTATEIDEFADIARSVGALLVHDCTYRDFAADHTPAIASSAENAVVVLSFSKWLGLAGLRLGALVASPRLINEFNAVATAVLGPSVFAQRMAQAGLSVKSEWMASLRAIDRGNKQKIVDAASRIPGFETPIPRSNGNFLIVEVLRSGIAPEALAAAARQRRFMIRPGRYHTERFGDRFVKISTSVPSEWVDEFCDALPGIVDVASRINSPQTVF